MRRFKKRYSGVNINSVAILEKEAQLLNIYGLRNKKQIQKAKYLFGAWKRTYRSYVVENKTIKNLTTKLYRLGILQTPKPTLNTIEKFNLQSILKRRLQSVVKNKYNLTPFQARHYITSGLVFVDQKRISQPSFLVRTQNEEKIRLKIKSKDCQSG